jgi:hypothetical protein
VLPVLKKSYKRRTINLIILVHFVKLINTGGIKKFISITVAPKSRTLPVPLQHRSEIIKWSQFLAFSLLTYAYYYHLPCQEKILIYCNPVGSNRRLLRVLTSIIWFPNLISFLYQISKRVNNRKYNFYLFQNIIQKSTSFSSRRLSTYCKSS